MMRAAIGALAGLLALAAPVWGQAGEAASPSPAPGARIAAPPTPQERQCHAAGWMREVVRAAGLERLVLWKAPPTWTRGAIVVLHGGGGAHTHFCVANVPLIAPQVGFTEQALARGFAVFLLDSSDQVRDRAGRLCGKVWDDEVRDRPNLDLPFLGSVLAGLIPQRRPAGSRAEVFLTGHSSGGFMSVRAASHFPDLLRAVAPVASGDPYGWFRDCSPRRGDRPNVFGAAFDIETRRQIVEPGACESAHHPGEQPWDDRPGARKPVFRMVFHAQDGIVDASCVAKVRGQLRARGYPEVAPFRLDDGERRFLAHYWQAAYNDAILSFFESEQR